MSVTTLSVAQITHDLAHRRTLVLLTWPDDPERRLSLPVPFDTPSADVETAALVAVRALAAQLAEAAIYAPDR